jgi:hypothetical protein
VSEPWPGCHGVRLEGDAIGLGTASGSPLADATLRFDKVDVAGGTQLWNQHSESEFDGDVVSVDRALRRSPRDTFVLTGSRGPALEVDQSNNTITVDDGARAVQQQLLVTFGLPLILHTTGALVLHASACTRDGHTVVVCGQPGAGKSSLVVGLLDAGWTAVSEDLCAIDLRGDAPVVWPGPPWVRIGLKQPGPVGSDVAFDAVHKTAWDIGAAQTRAAVSVTQLVLLEPPGGDAPSFEPVPIAVAIREFAHHAVWLGEADERGQRLFGPTAELTSKVPTSRLRLPRSDAWLTGVPEILAARG